MPFIPGAPRLGSSKGGKDAVTQPHLPCSLSSSWAKHNSAPPRLLQKAGRAASSSRGSVHTPSESLLQRRRDHKARDCPQPQRLGLTWSTQCAVSSSVPFVSGQASELQLKGLGAWGRGRGHGPWGSLSAHVLNLAPHSSSGEWHVHRRPGSSSHPGQNEASPWEDSSSWWGVSIQPVILRPMWGAEPESRSSQCG